MRFHTAQHDLRFTGFFQRPTCPQCGDGLFAATATEFVSNGLILHTWHCESCAHEFRTAVDIPAAAA